MRLMRGGVSARHTCAPNNIRCQDYCTTDLADITSIIDTADRTLFRKILANLAHHLPEKASTHYNLRPRQHDRQLIPQN